MLALLILNISAGILLASLSIPLILRKVPPNPFYGIRVRRTVSNPAVWYEANAYFARCLLLFSLVLIAASIGLYFCPGLELLTYLFSVQAVALVGIVLVVVQSFRYLNRIPG